MTLETYWLVVAPAVMVGLSLIGWAALLFTRNQATVLPFGGAAAAGMRAALDDLDRSGEAAFQDIATTFRQRLASDPDNQDLQQELVRVVQQELARRVRMPPRQEPARVQEEIQRLLKEGRLQHGER